MALEHSQINNGQLLLNSNIRTMIDQYDMECNQTKTLTIAL